MDLSKLRGRVLSKHTEVADLKVWLLVRTHTEYVTCWVSLREGQPTEWLEGKYFREWPHAVRSFAERIVAGLPED